MNAFCSAQGAKLQPAPPSPQRQLPNNKWQQMETSQFLPENQQMLQQMSALASTVSRRSRASTKISPQSA
jgi:hypothetical protein